MDSLIPNRKPELLGDETPDNAFVQQEKINAQRKQVEAEQGLTFPSLRQGTFTSALGQFASRYLLRKEGNEWKFMPGSDANWTFERKQEALKNARRYDGTPFSDEDSVGLLMASNSEDDFKARLGVLLENETDGQRIGAAGLGGQAAVLTAGLLGDLPLSMAGGRALSLGAKGLGLTTAPSRALSIAGGVGSNIAQNVADSKLRGQSYDTDEQLGWDVLLGAAGGAFTRLPKTPQGARAAENIKKNVEVTPPAAKPLEGETIDMFGGRPEIPSVQVVADRLARATGEQLFSSVEKPHVVGKNKEGKEVSFTNGLDYAAYRLSGLMDKSLKSRKESLEKVDMPDTAVFNDSIGAEAAELIGAIRDVLPGITDANLYQYAKRVRDEVNSAKEGSGTQVFDVWRNFTEHLGNNERATPAEKLKPQPKAPKEDTQTADMFGEATEPPTAPVHYPLATRSSYGAATIPDLNVIDMESRWVSDAVAVRNTADEVLDAAPQRDHVAGLLEWDNIIDGTDLVREARREQAALGNPLIKPIHRLTMESLQSPEGLKAVAQADAAQVLQSKDVPEAALNKIDEIVEQHPVGSPVAETRIDEISAAVEQSNLPPLEKAIVQELVSHAKREGKEVRETLLQVGKEKDSDPELKLPEHLRSAKLLIKGKHVPVAFTTTVDKALALAHKENGRKTNKFYKDAVDYLQKLYPELTEEDINAGAKWFRDNVLNPEADRGDMAFKVPEAATSILGSTKKEVEKKVYAQDPSVKYKASSGAFVVPAAARQNSDTFNRQAEMRYQIKVMEQFLVDADGMSPVLRTEELIAEELTHWDAEVAAGRELTSDQAKHVDTLRNLDRDGFVPADYQHFWEYKQSKLVSEIKRLKDQMEYEETLAKAMSYKKPDEGKSGEVKIYTKEEIAAMNIQPSKPKVDYDVPTLDNGPRGETKKRKNLSEDSDGDAFADDAVEAIQDRMDDGKVPGMDEFKLDDEGLDFEFADVVEEVEQEAPKLSAFDMQKQREAASAERKFSENKAKVDAYVQEPRDKTGHVSIEQSTFLHYADTRQETTTAKVLIKSFNPDSVTMKDGSWKVEAKVVLPGKKRVVSMWIDARAIPPKEGVNYSKADTLSKLGGMVSKLFGKVGQELLDSGKLKVVKSVDELPGKHPHDVKGMYDKASGVAYVVMRNISDTADFYSTVLHEIGVHMGMPKIFGDLWSKVLSDVDAVPELKAIKEKLRGEVPDAHLNEEAIAYYVQLNPNASFTQRIVSGLKLWAYKLAGGRFIKLGAKDMVALAVQALRKEARSYDKPFEGMYVNHFKGWDPAEDALPEGHPEQTYYSTAKGVAAAAPKQEPSLFNFVGKLKWLGGQTSHFGQTMGHRLAESSNPIVRSFSTGWLTGFDPDGKQGTNGAVTYLDQLVKSWFNPFKASMESNFNAYYKGRENRFQGKDTAMREFNEQVFLATQGILNLDDAHPSVKAQVQAVREATAKPLAELSEMAQRMTAFGHDLKGSLLRHWTGIKANGNYLPRLLNYENFNKFRAGLGREGLVKAVAKAMQKATPSAKPEKIDLMADAYVSWIELNEVRENSDVISLGLNREELVKMLKADDSGRFAKMNPDVFNDLVDTILDTQQVIESSDTRTRARIQMDMSLQVELDGEKVYLAQMFETDVMSLLSRYQRQAAGMGARAKASMLTPLRHMEDIDKKKLPEWVKERNGQLFADMTHETYFGWVMSQATRSSLRDSDPSVHSQVMEDMQGLWRFLNGQPLKVGNEGDGARLIRVLRNFTTFARAWMFPLSMTAEMAKQFNSRTFVAAARHFPSLIKDIVAMREGKDSYERAKRLSQFFGIGLDSTVLPSYQRVSGMLGSLESMSENARNFTLRRSGFNAVNNANRLFAMRVELEHLLRIGRGEVKASYNDIRRYQAYGIPESKLDEVAAQAARHYDPTRGELNFQAFQAENWDNAQLAKMYVYRMAKKGSSEAFIDQTQSWAHGPVADLFLQFQRSSMDGFLLHGVQEWQFRDPEAYTGFVMGYLGGMAGYAAVTTLRFGQDDKELKKRLSAVELAKNAFARAAYAGLVTKVMDLVSMGLGFQPIFSGRNSANQQGFAPASLQSLASVPSALGALTGLPFGSTTVNEAKKAISLVGGTPVLLLPAVEDFIQSSLPKQLPKQDADDLLKR